MLIISAKILFPNKATSTGTGGQDFNISFGHGRRGVVHNITHGPLALATLVPSTESDPKRSEADPCDCTDDRAGVLWVQAGEGISEREGS